MATHAAVEAIGRAILEILKEASRTEFPQARFTTVRPENLTQQAESGVSVYLYRMALDSTAHNFPPVVTRTGRHRPPYGLSLHFLLTPWGSDARTEQLLLAWALNTLMNTPILTPQQLDRLSAKTFGADETVELRFEELTVADMSALWRSLDIPQRLSMSCVARVLISDQATTIDEAVMRR